MADVESTVGFGIEDFAVFFGMLGLTMLIGVYYAWKDRKNETMDTYYFGGRNMHPIPVALSISVTNVSALVLITFPAETYLFGMVTAWYCFAMIIPTIIHCTFYVPLCIRLQLSSLYEYLERRFDHRVRKLGSSIMCIVMVFLMAVTVYVPGLALSAVTPLSIPVTILITGATCTFYTTLGGMKAVVWTDTLQTVIMLAGTLAVFIKSTMVVGGFGEAWAALDRGGRLNMLNFNLDPTIRTTFWTVIGGCAVTWSTPNQAIIQRYLTCGTIKRARQAAFMSMFPSVIFVGIAIWSGATMYAYYEDCDLIMSGKIEKPDQMIPYMVMEIFQDLPGMAGLFVAAAFSGTLSTISSGINSLASLIMEDFILVWKPKIKSAKKVTISKLIVLFFGSTVTGLALVVMNIDATVFQLAYTFFGIIAGPLVGVFALGMFLPWANTKGVFIGQAVGTVVTGWIAFGAFFYGNSPSANRVLPASIEGCRVVNNETTMMTTFMNVTLPSEFEENGSVLDSTLYALSFLYYGILSLTVTVLFGLIGSFITGANKPSESDPILFVPIISHPIFPKRIRNFFRFGVPHLRYSDECSASDESKEKLSTKSLEDPVGSKSDSIIKPNNFKESVA